MKCSVPWSEDLNTQTGKVPCKLRHWSRTTDILEMQSRSITLKEKTMESIGHRQAWSEEWISGLVDKAETVHSNIQERKTNSNDKIVQELLETFKRTT